LLRYIQKIIFRNTLKDNAGTFKAAISLALSCDKDETMTSNAQKAEILFRYKLN